MAVAIRLKRIGRKKQPFYRIVVADEKNPRQGIFVDDLGYYNPMKDPAEIKLDIDRAVDWVKKGAIATDTARSILRRTGVLKKVHEMRYPPKNKPEEEAETQDEEIKEAEEKAETAPAEDAEDDDSQSE
ncbi:30S ribosomal protein S16 [Candidatus Poribacteria bacterium]|nr:30S ribosomal protein S16 [Candidatus Poribacteria bacterium]